jgi:hypothetical protein
MKLKALTASALLLAAGFSSAYAATGTTVAGDLLLGFRATDGATDSNLEVNLGQASTFQNFAAADGSLVNLNSRLSVADLSAVYGDGWANNTEVRFGLAGGLTSTNTLWEANQRTDGLLQSSVLPTSGAGSQATVNSVIAKYQGLSTATKVGQSFTQVNQTSNSIYSVIADGTKNGSYTKQGATTAYFNTAGVYTIDVEKDTTASLNTIGSAWALTDLYLQAPASGGQATYLGTFGLALANGAAVNSGLTYNAGDLVYEYNSATQFTVIPEPSTYAAILGALTVGFVALRRRFSKAV